MRHVSLLEKDDPTNVVMPVYRSNQAGVLNARREAEIAAQKAKADSSSKQGSVFAQAACGATKGTT